MTRLPRSPDSTLVLRLDFGFEAQPRNRPRLRPAVLATLRPALDSAGHRVPRTKPTCLLHTWRPHRQWPSTLNLHPHQHQSRRNLHLQYLAKSQSTQRFQSLITPGSDHPPILEPLMVLIPAQYSEPVTPKRSPPKKQVWRKKDQSTPSEDQSLPMSSTDQSMATASTPWE
jgi:hypothetical protein